MKKGIPLSLPNDSQHDSVCYPEFIRVITLKIDFLIENSFGKFCCYNVNHDNQQQKQISGEIERAESKNMSKSG